MVGDGATDRREEGGGRDTALLDLGGEKAGECAGGCFLSGRGREGVARHRAMEAAPPRGHERTGGAAAHSGEGGGREDEGRREDGKGNLTWAIQ
jgi:hypothetical protein